MGIASWFRSHRSPTSGNRHAGARKVPPRRLRLALERLEDRTVPATLVVTSADDPPGPLVPGTLRYEVNQANQEARVGQSDTIIFDRTQMGSSTVALGQGALVLNGSGLGVLGGMEAIDGGGRVTISGNHLDPYHADHVFLIDFDVRANLTGLTIRDGADDEGGSICNRGALTVTNAILRDNACGIYNEGTMTLSNCTVSGNSAVIYGAGIVNRGTMTLANSTVAGNTCLEGAGGISNGGTLTAINCTIADNIAFCFGVGGISNGGTLTATNCTIADNSDPDYGVGGVANGGTATIKNTIIAGNTGKDVPSDYEESQTPPLPYDVDGTLTSEGHNLIGNGDHSSGFGWGLGFEFRGFPTSGDQVGTLSSPIDPLLGPLQDNGGPTQTMALLPGSPAIDRGSNALVPADLTTDQRGPGFDRVSGDSVDIGAFEHQRPSFTASSLNDTAKAWENMALAIPWDSVGDVDSSTLTITVAVGHGTLTLATPLRPA
jgi:hypothetical protein